MTGFREFLHSWITPGSAAGEVVLVFGSLAFVVLAAFCWVTFFHTPRKRRHLYHHHHHAKFETESAAEAAEPETSSLRLIRRRHHRRHRRTERQLNPTLAQVGGLPAPRPDDEPPSV